MKRDDQSKKKLASVRSKVANKAHRTTSKPDGKRRPTLYEQIPIGIVESSLQGKYINANAEFCKLVGYQKEQLLALDIKDIIFEQDYPVVIQLYRQLAEGKIPSYKLEKRYVRKDGKVIWVEAKRSLVRNSRGKALYSIGAVMDVTERRTRLARQQEALYQFTDQLDRASSLEDVYNGAIEAVLGALQCNRAAIMLFDRKGLGRFVAWRGLSERYRKAMEGQVLWKSDENSTQPAWICIDDIGTADLSAPLKTGFAKERIGSFAAVPLLFNDKLTGGLMAYFDRPHAFGVDEMEFCLAIARQLSFRIDRKRVEESLRETEDRYRRIVETANEGIWEIDKDTRTVFVNARMAQMLGYTVEEMLGRPVFEFMCPEDYSEGERRLERARKGISGRSGELRYLRKDGSVVWTIASRTPKLDAQGNFVGAFAMISDITEQKQAEESLRELNLELENRVRARTAELQTANQILLEEIAERREVEELLRSWAHIFEHADWGIATVLKDTFVMMNPTFAKMHGYAVEELIGHSIYDVLALESHADTREQIEIAYKYGHHVYESKHIRKDGSIFPALVDTSVVTDEAGNVLYRAINIRDITQRKEAERALNESRQYLQELSKRLIEVQEEERRAIARELHDRVGQNLSALSLNLGMMKDQLSQGSPQNTDARIDDSLRLVGETNKLVRDLLTELRPAVLDEFGLTAALQAYIDEFTPRYNIQVVLEVANEPLPHLNPSLEITLLRIAQEALTNIARHAQATQATLSLRLEKNTVHLIIADNGIGIESSQGPGPRIGHGLKIMRERAEAFGGTVEVGPAEAKGTRVEAIIPIESAGQVEKR